MAAVVSHLPETSMDADIKCYKAFQITAHTEEATVLASLFKPTHMITICHQPVMGY